MDEQRALCRHVHFPVEQVLREEQAVLGDLAARTLAGRVWARWGPPAIPKDPRDSSGPLGCPGRGRGSPGLTVGVELGTPGVGHPRELARAVLGGHTLPAGVLVEPLGTDTAGLTLGGHLQGGGWQPLGRWAPSTPPQPAPCIRPFPEPLSKPSPPLGEVSGLCTSRPGRWAPSFLSPSWGDPVHSPRETPQMAHCLPAARLPSPTVRALHGEIATGVRVWPCLPQGHCGHPLMAQWKALGPSTASMSPQVVWWRLSSGGLPAPGLPQPYAWCAGG